MTLAELEKLSFDHPILFFDGHCMICSNYFHWIFNRDRKKLLRYGRLSSDIGQDVKATNKIQNNLDTVILIMDGKYWVESDVVFQLIKKLGGFYLIFYPLVVIPKDIRNAVYRWVSRNRYQWFGRLSQCMIPDEIQKDQFVDGVV